MNWLIKLPLRNSLRTQISLVCGVLSLVLSLVLSFYAAEVSKRQIEQSDGESFASRTSSILEVMDRGMFERAREIQNAANLTELSEPSVSIARKREILERLQNTFHAYAWIGICDVNGMGLVGTGKYLEGKDLSKRPWCNKGRENYYIGDMHDALLLSKLLPNPSGEQFYLVDVAAPILDKKGVLQGVLCGHIFWRWAEEALEGGKSQGKDVFLLSKEGLVLSGPAELRSNFAKVAPQTMQMIQQESDKSGYLIERSSDGKTYLVGWAKSVGYLNYKGLGWVAVMRQDVTQAFAPATELRKHIFSVGLLLGLFFAYLGWLLAGRIVRPIKLLSAAAEKIAAGHLVYEAAAVTGEGEVAHLSRAMHDMVAHLIREKSERQQSEELFNAAVEAAPNGMIIVDARGSIVMLNTKITDLFGYSEAELLGQSINYLLPQPLHHAHSAQVRDFVAQPTKRAMGTGRDLFGQHKDGRQVQVEIALCPLQIHGESFVLASVVDITELKKTLEKLRTTASELEYANSLVKAEREQLMVRVEERTVQLQRANHAKDSFLATMSHEIRTPLAGLLGMLELLTFSKLEAAQQQQLSAAQRSGYSLLRIVNDILDWSKIEAGKLELDMQNASLAELLQSVANTYTQIASKKNILLKIELDPSLSEVHRFDPLRLSQILNNFISNALKFTEHGCVKLSAHLLAQHNGNETIRFSVHDTGMGISPEQQQRLFKTYEQASAETARMYGGTGLGLAICHRLAELMNGALSVVSTLGHGSTFSFTVDLPIADAATQTSFKLAHAHAPQNQVSTQHDIAPLANHGEVINILIVDDHPVNRMLLKQQLHLLGVQVEVAVDGNEALQRYQAQAFDLIITDCHMPEMDGYELTFRIREQERAMASRRLPIIAWTANVLVEEEEHCRAAGMDDLLTKPTELTDLRAMLLRWLIRAGVLSNET